MRTGEACGWLGFATELRLTGRVASESGFVNLEQRFTYYGQKQWP